MRLNQNSLLFLVLCFFSFVLSSCTKTAFEDTYSFEDNGWSKDDIRAFSINITDTTKLYDIHLEVTNESDYGYSNVYIFSNIIFPTKQYTRDTIEFMLTDPAGEWSGDGWFSKTNTFIFKKDVRFPKPGTYTFSFEQAMRCTNPECTLYGIENIGLRLIEK